jgi:hypothetical protein
MFCVSSGQDIWRVVFVIFMRNICAFIDQKLANSIFSLSNRVVKGRLAFFVLQINITATLGQVVAHFKLALSASIEKAGLAKSVKMVDFGA